jgi:hypothetical protein
MQVYRGLFKTVQEKVMNLTKTRFQQEQHRFNLAKDTIIHYLCVEKLILTRTVMRMTFSVPTDQFSTVHRNEEVA